MELDKYATEDALKYARLIQEHHADIIMGQHCDKCRHYFDMMVGHMLYAVQKQLNKGGDNG